MSTDQLAQINIGRLIAPIDDPRIAGFVSQLAAINALAESSPGFVWRLKSEAGNATDIAYNDDPLVIGNMSVWDSVPSGHRPTVAEGRERLEHYQLHGATPHAFG